MDGIEDGFQFADRVVPWGTRLDDLARLTGCSAGREIDVACRLAYGLPALAARARGPRADRPVLQVEYDLADIGGLRPQDWVGAVSDRLGPPAALDRRDIPPGARPQDSVVLYARWERGDTAVGLSLYGAPRDVSDARSVGMLWVGWSVDRAAAPYLAAWREGCVQLADGAARLSDVTVYALAWPGHPVLGGGVSASAAPAARERRIRQLCLYSPEVLATPDAIARRLTASSFAVWHDVAGGTWGLSTLWDTLRHRCRAAVSVDWIELAPAKGGGYGALEVGGWRVVSAHGSRSLADAARQLESFPGVTVVRHTGYDA